MKLVSTTTARKEIGRLINKIKRDNSILGIGRRDQIEAVLIKYPEYLNHTLDEITNINANSSSFDFLSSEPEIYSIRDLKKRYV